MRFGENNINAEYCQPDKEFDARSVEWQLISLGASL